MKAAGDAYHVLLNARNGKPPSLQQTSRKVAEFTNDWLGGDMAAFYGFIRERLPEPITDARLVADPVAAATRLHARFLETVRPNAPNEGRLGFEAGRLTSFAADYVRWVEGAGVWPTTADLKNIEYALQAIAEDVATAWSVFVQIVGDACFADLESPARQGRPVSAVDVRGAGVELPSRPATPPPLQAPNHTAVPAEPPPLPPLQRSAIPTEPPPLSDPRTAKPQ
jgi:hypothetical protein